MAVIAELHPQAGESLLFVPSSDKAAVHDGSTGFASRESFCYALHLSDQASRNRPIWRKDGQNDVGLGKGDIRKEG